MALNANALTTLAQARSHLAVPASNLVEGPRIELFINSASERIERFCDRKFKAASYTELHHGNGQNFLIPVQYPINSITELRVSASQDWGSADSLIPTSDYVIADFDQTVVYASQFPKGFANVRIIYSGGYTTTPSDLELACLWLVEWYFRHRERGDTGRTSVSKGDESVGILAEAPKMIIEILMDYKRTEVPNAVAPVRFL